MGGLRFMGTGDDYDDGFVYGTPRSPFYISEIQWDSLPLDVHNQMAHAHLYPTGECVKNTYGPLCEERW